MKNNIEMVQIVGIGMACTNMHHTYCPSKSMTQAPYYCSLCIPVLYFPPFKLGWVYAVWVVNCVSKCKTLSVVITMVQIQVWFTLLCVVYITVLCVKPSQSCLPTFCAIPIFHIVNRRIFHHIPLYAKSSWRIFCVVGLFACMLYLTAYCLCV